MWGTYRATVPKSIKPQEPSLKGHSNRVNAIVLLLHKAFEEKNEWVNKQIKVNTTVASHSCWRKEGKKEGRRKAERHHLHTLPWETSYHARLLTCKCPNYMQAGDQAEKEIRNHTPWSQEGECWWVIFFWNSGNFCLQKNLTLSSIKTWDAP